MDIEVDYFSNSIDFSGNEDLGGLFSKMFPDYSTVTVETISKYSYPRWMNSGMVWRGEYSMQNTLEHPKEDVASSLSSWKPAVRESAFEPDGDYFVAKSGMGKRSKDGSEVGKGDGSSVTFSIQHAGINRKPSAGPQAKGYRSDEETYTLDSRGSSDAVCSPNDGFGIRKTTGVSENWTLIDQSGR